MFNDNGVKLIPADKRFCPEDACEKEVTEATDEQIKQIMKYRQDFFLQFYDSDRKKRINERLTNKENFIYTCCEKNILIPIAVVESLLSDRRTLFSAEYLDYQYNHAALSQLGKNDRDEKCINFALISAPSKWESSFKDTLEHLMNRAHEEKKPLISYYNKLYDFYRRIEDTEKLNALNSLVQCNQSDSGLDPDDMITYLLDILGQCRKWEENNKKSFLESAPKETYSDFVFAAMLGRESPHQEILNDVSDRFLGRMQQEKKSAALYDEILLDAYKKAKSKISSAVLDKIKEWYPDTKIPTNAAIYFLHHIINKCADHERDIKGMKDLLGAGNFSLTYTSKDVQEAQEYISRKNEFESLRRSFTEWQQSHEFPFNGEEDAGEEFGKSIDISNVITISDTQLDDIRVHLTDYIVNTRSTVTELSNDTIQHIITQVYNRFRNLAPFRLMVLCSIGGGAFLVGRRSLTKDYLKDFLKKVDSKSSDRNRYHRFLLLVRLCKDFNSSSQDIETNLLYFMKYHGIGIESDEESKLWKETLQENDLLDSAVSLSLKYDENLKECFPIHLKSLFCYESCSALHLGGFYELTQAFPELVEHYRYGVTAPKRICQKYIYVWPNEKRSQDLKNGKAGRDAIKEICHKSIKSLKWDELDKTKEWIGQWDIESKNGHFRSKVPIDMEELRAIFSEIAIKGTIVRNAKKYLFMQIQSHYKGAIKFVN